MEKPYFPVGMFIIALFRDSILDVIVFILTITLLPLGWMFGIFIGFIYTGIFFIWFTHFKSIAMQERMMKKFLLRISINTVISFIPILRLIVPENTILVLLTYSHEKKEWKKYQEQQRKTIAKTPPPLKRRGGRVHA